MFVNGAMEPIQEGTPGSESQVLAELSNHVGVQRIAADNSEMRTADNNNYLINGVQLVFGSIDRVYQSIFKRCGLGTESNIHGSGSCQRQTCQQLRIDAEHWRVKHAEAIDQSSSLYARLDQKDEQLRKTHNELDDALLRNKSLAKKLAENEQALDETRRQLLKAKEKEVRMRDIVLEKTSTNRISDHEVREKFLCIRQRAQAISHSSAFDLEHLDPRIWGHLNLKDRKNIVMADIFSMLHYHIFDCKIFCPNEIAYDNIDPGCNLAMEMELARIETILEYNRVKDSLVTNWRIATIDCLSELVSPSLSLKPVAPMIFAYFAPVISSRATIEERFELQKQFEILCNDAWDVAMIMRRSREGHKCIAPPTRTSQCLISTYNVLVEPITVEGGNTEDRSEEIAYSLFGALVKGSHDSKESEGRVLEKAQVVLKRR